MNTQSKLLDKLSKELLFFDGAMGTILQNKGLKLGELPELLNISNADIIVDIHKDYINAGCNIIKTNTFGANSLKLKDTDFSVADVIKAGITNAKKAIKQTNSETLIALDIGPTGKLLSPLGDLEFEQAYNIFKEIVLCSKDADLILIETMSDTYEVKAAVLAAKENSDLPIFVTLTFDENKKLLTGANVETSVALLESLGVNAIGLNCGLGPIQMKEIVSDLIKCSSTPIVLNPNAGLPTIVDGNTVFTLLPEDFAKAMQNLLKDGVSVIGGCCGTTPKHIEKMIKLCKDTKIKPIKPKKRTVVSSYSKCVVFDNKPIIIGERINPTGKARLKQALREKDMNYIYREALTQTECGADILDVNVGAPEIDEVSMMESAIRGLQGITDTPLQIDTSNIKAMERALRIYNGRPLINSVNGKQESLDKILPLAKKYGAVVVALTLDDNGIPETLQGRIEIAEKIINEANKYGIPKENIIVDPLTMTISTGQENANITLQAVNYIKNTMGVHTVLGVSNVSFGLPQRDIINSNFYTMAMNNGLSAGIINPNSIEMMKAYRSFCALKGYDIGCSNYINAYSSQETVKENNNIELTLKQTIVKGLKEQAFTTAQIMVDKNNPLDIINQEIIPALDYVGKEFEQNRLFLPQLLMSADAAKNAFDAIKDYMVKTGTKQEKRGKIIMATVKGDIHDIGKNIVKVLLENYCFDVIDLGKDVDPDLIVKTAIEENIKLVGLSALMTTTVSNMEITIKKLRKACSCKIMVGGAVLTEEYAKQIGADFYSKDAMGSVHYANELFQNN